jgi:hypothetical protein
MVLSIAVPLAAIYAGTLALTYRALRDRGYREMEENVTKLAAHYAAEIDGQFRRFAQVGMSTARYLEIEHDLDAERLYEILRANVEQDPLIYGSCVSFEPYAYDGETRLFCPYVYRSGGELARMDVADAYDYTDPKWEWYRIPRETGEAFWTEPFFDEGAGNIIMCTHVTPFFTEDGRFRGTVNIDIPIKELQAKARLTELGAGTFIIISRTGRFVSHPDPSLVMHESALSVARRLERDDVAELARRMLRGESGVMRLANFPTPEPRWLFFAPVPGAFDRLVVLRRSA